MEAQMVMRTAVKEFAAPSIPLVSPIMGVRAGSTLPAVVVKSKK
jgi:hypothetical protein